MVQLNLYRVCPDLACILPLQLAKDFESPLIQVSPSSYQGMWPGVIPAMGWDSSLNSFQVSCYNPIGISIVLNIKKILQISSYRCHFSWGVLQIRCDLRNDTLVTLTWDLFRLLWFTLASSLATPCFSSSMTDLTFCGVFITAASVLHPDSKLLLCIHFNAKKVRPQVKLHLLLLLAYFRLPASQLAKTFLLIFLKYGHFSHFFINTFSWPLYLPAGNETYQA